MSELKHDKWKGNTGGTPWMQRFLIVWLRHLSLRSLYAVMACAIPWYVLLSGRGRRAMWLYFRRRQGFGPMRSLRMLFLNFYRFGQVILDRFAVYAGQEFRFEFDGVWKFYDCLKTGDGIVWLSAHVGNFEITGYSLSVEGRRVNSLVFDGETETVTENRAKVFEGNNIRMIPVKADLSHIFLMNSALADGEIVTVHGDRLFGSSKSLVHDFLNFPAKFPKGPFALAASRDVPVFAVFAMRTGYKSYRVIWRRLDAVEEDGVSAGAGCGVSAGEGCGVSAGAPVGWNCGADSGTPVGKIAALFGRYVSELETVVREYPEQWFNYYDFWGDALSRA